MTWTREPPTKPGIYWVRTQAGAKPVEVFRADDMGQLAVYILGSDLFVDVHLMTHCLWHPATPPELPKEKLEHET